jgi:hypothetical protein
LLQQHRVPTEFLNALVRHHLQRDAIDFLTQGLTKRVAVRWGSPCNQLTAPEELTEVCHTAFNAALQWVLDPRAEKRLRAMVAERGTGNSRWLSGTGSGLEQWQSRWSGVAGAHSTARACDRVARWRCTFQGLHPAGSAGLFQLPMHPSRAGNGTGLGSEPPDPSQNWFRARSCSCER